VTRVAQGGEDFGLDEISLLWHRLISISGAGEDLLQRLDGEKASQRVHPLLNEPAGK
jgi:hypothetical protein